ncbi:hypothetical protein KR044_001039 [Drosophila immigrans]|nr:hypothetical protein KR044_001039 [Drosophila immigrans]
MQFQFLLLLPLLMLLIIFSQPGQSQSFLDVVNGVLGFIHDAREIVSIVRWDIEVLDEDIGEFDSAKIHENQIKILQHFNNISTQVDQIEKDHVTISKKSLYDHFAYNNTEMDKIHNMVNNIEEVSEEFEKFKKMANSENNTVIISFGTEIACPSTNTFLSNDFYWKLFGHPVINEEILNRLRKRYEMPSDKICHSLQSPQQIVYSLYKDIALTELKAYILIEYSLLIRRVSGQGNFFTETNRVRVNYKNISESALDTLINTMQQADRVLWRCDPDKHAHKVTYDEVTRLLQGYVENEVDLSNNESCSQTCPDYRNTTRKGCFDQKFCSQQPQCSGRIHNCRLVDSDLSVCQSPENSNRRYEFIKYGDGKWFGERQNCWRDVNNVESWSRWIFTKCSYCFCLCDEPSPKSDRYFNLRPTFSDALANKVVTGVRFVKKNRIFHLQIQQGQLLPRGGINESTVEWKPVDDYKIDDVNVTEGVDYHALSNEKRRINLDEVIYPYGRTLIVTGLDFSVRRGRLRLRVLFSIYHFEEGRINGYYAREGEEHLTRHSIANSDIENKRLDIDNLDLPTRSLHKSQPLSKDQHYVEFVNTGMEQDAAQTTIPFIDLQDVVSNPPVPLAGIGIYYKSSPGYGGFIAPKIISYHFPAYVRMPTPEP